MSFRQGLSRGGTGGCGAGRWRGRRRLTPPRTGARRRRHSRRSRRGRLTSPRRRSARQMTPAASCCWAAWRSPLPASQAAPPGGPAAAATPLLPPPSHQALPPCARTTHWRWKRPHRAGTRWQRCAARAAAPAAAAACFKAVWPCGLQGGPAWRAHARLLLVWVWARRVANYHLWPVGVSAWSVHQWSAKALPVSDMTALARHPPAGEAAGGRHAHPGLCSGRAQLCAGSSGCRELPHAAGAAVSRPSGDCPHRVWRARAPWTEPGLQLGGARSWQGCGVGWGGTRLYAFWMSICIRGCTHAATAACIAARALRTGHASLAAAHRARSPPACSGFCPTAVQLRAAFLEADGISALRELLDNPSDRVRRRGVKGRGVAEGGKGKSDEHEHI